MHGLLYHITHPSERKQLSISQELAISSIFQQGSNTSQMLFYLSQTALCHCIHCLAISFSCEWREPGLVLSVVFVSESSGGLACYLSTGTSTLQNHSLVASTVFFPLCLKSSGLMLWTGILSWGFYGHENMKKGGK